MNPVRSAAADHLSPPKPGSRTPGVAVLVIASLVIVAVLLCPGSAHAQISAAQSLSLTPEARAQGMGRAYTAIAAGPAAQWWNPGALALQGDQIQFRPFSYTKLVPDLADDIWWFNTSAAADFGPFGIGGHYRRLSYGESDVVDRNGQLLGTFDSSEYALYFGAGADLVELLVPEVANFELGVGMNFKYASVDLAPSWATENGRPGTGSGTDVDLGALARVTLPLESSRLWFSGGWTRINAENNRLDYDGGGSGPLVQTERIGLAASFATGVHPRFGDIATVTLGYDNVDRAGNSTRVQNYGIELDALGLVAFRLGVIDDPDRDIEDSTRGIGVHFDQPLSDTGRSLGFQFDFARVPQATGLENVDHYSVHLSLTPSRAVPGDSRSR